MDPSPLAWEQLKYIFASYFTTFFQLLLRKERKTGNIPPHCLLSIKLRTSDSNCLYTIFPLKKVFRTWDAKTAHFVKAKYTQRGDNRQRHSKESTQSGFAFDNSSTNNLTLSSSQIRTNQITVVKYLQMAVLTLRCLSGVSCGAAP